MNTEVWKLGALAANRGNREHRADRAQTPPGTHRCSTPVAHEK